MSRQIDSYIRAYRIFKYKHHAPSLCQNLILTHLNGFNKKFFFPFLFLGQSKLIDTRTFTRPKKKMHQLSDSKLLSIPSGSESMSEEQQQQTPPPQQLHQANGINLQIGGLVTSMQKSFLLDTSPPSTMCSSIDMTSSNRFNHSLITSNDFTNINQYLGGSESGGGNQQSSYNGYNIDNVINDRTFLEKLTMGTTDDDTFLKDSCISNTDNHYLENISSGQSTLHNSDEFVVSSNNNTKTIVKLNTTIENGIGDVDDQTFMKTRNAIVNETFDAASPDVKGRFNATYDLIQLNTPTRSETAEIQPTTNNAGTDTIVLGTNNETYDAISTPDMQTPVDNKTFEFPETGSNKFTHLAAGNDPINSPGGKLLIISTPQSDFSVKSKNRRSLNLSPIILAGNGTPTVAPITDSQLGYEKYVHDIGQQYSLEPKTENSVAMITNVIAANDNALDVDDDKNDDDIGDDCDDDEDDDGDDDFIVEKRRHSNPLYDADEMELMNKLERERRSLANFEEFEKSISMLEDNNKTEKEFDDILNSITNNDNKMINERMRQNLDSIKKRHYLMNLETQEKSAINMPNTTIISSSSSSVEQQKNQTNLSQNQNNSNSNSHNSVDITLIDSNKLNDSMNGGGGVLRSSMTSSSSSSSERLLNRRSRMYDELNSSTEATTTSTTNDTTINPATINDKPATTNNRDRFKTMRIFKRADEVTNLPDAEKGVLSNGERFSKKDENSPKEPEHSEPVPAIPQPPRRRALSKPRFFGYKSNAFTQQPMKSCSADDLDQNDPSNSENDDHGHGSNDLINSKLKSPMGIKAKSVHNLIGGAGSKMSSLMSRPGSRLQPGGSNIDYEVSV